MYRNIENDLYKMKIGGIIDLNYAFFMSMSFPELIILPLIFPQMINTRNQPRTDTIGDIFGTGAFKSTDK